MIAGAVIFCSLLLEGIKTQHLFFGGSVVVLTPNRRCLGHVMKPVQVILNPVINAIAPITQVNLTT